MRAIGLILVILGALGLGWPELRETGKKLAVSNRGAGAIASEKAQQAIPPVVSGIAVTSGLILMASALKRT
jgi:hypothetical protein